jgi:hypothetical protein
MISVTSTYLESIPGETFFTKALQSPISFVLGSKIIKQGKLLIFKQAHYYIQITIQNTRNQKETFEIPIPFKTEEYVHEGLIYFDYRVKSLVGKDEELCYRLSRAKIKNTTPSQYYNKILEIKTQLQ